MKTTRLLIKAHLLRWPSFAILTYCQSTLRSLAQACLASGIFLNSLTKLVYQHISIFTLCLLLLIPSSLWAPTRDTLHQQGFIVDLDGNPVEGSHDLTFRIYSQEEGGDSIWEETVTGLFSSGFYSVDLGEESPLPDTLMETAEDLYLSLAIDDEGEMTPRLAITAVPFARVAETALTALSVDDSIVLPRVFIEDFGEVINESGQWVGPTAGIQGPQGPAGPAGATGATGATGPTGLAGAQGNPTTVVAGSGLTGGGTGATVTLNIGGGTGITVAADEISLATDGVTTAHLLDGTILNADINSSAAIAGSKIAPNFGSQDVETTGDIEAAGGYKMMVGPFVEENLPVSTTNRQWSIGHEDNNVEDVAIPWAGSVMGVSVSCDTDLTGGTVTVEPLINGAATGLVATLSDTGGTNDKSAVASQAKDTEDTFSAGGRIGCRSSTNAGFLPTTADCACLIFIEM